MDSPLSPSTPFELALDIADLGSWDVDLTTGQVAWSRRHAAVQGYPEDLADPTFSHWQRRVHPDDVAAVTHAFEQARDTQSLFAVEHRVLRADTGELRWLALRGRFSYDEQGRAVRITGVSFDITDRKLAEERVRDSEARFYNMATHAPVMIWITEPDGRCSFLSDSWYAFTGQTAATGLGYGWLDAVHPDSREHAEAEFRAATRERRAFELEYRLRRHDGVYRWAIDAAAPRLSDRGEFLGFIGSVLDITPRKEAEQQLERRRAELQTMLDLLPVGIAIAHDSQAEQITVSPSLANLLRLAPGQNASLTGPASAQLRYRCERAGREIRGDELPMQRACRAGAQVRNEELDIVFDDGSRVPLLISASPLFDENGAVRGAIATHVDISALKETQHVLERADRQKDEFLAMLAHELRNPLAPIRYASQLLRASTAPATLDEIRKIVERQVAHMSRLLDDLLETSRITRGTLSLRREIVDLREVIEAAVDAARPLADKVDHAIRVRGMAHELPVDGDPTRLTQVLGNLLNNATRYTDPGGEIVVEASSTDDEVLVEVRDNGIGIPHDLQPRIFELFIQGDRQGRGGGGLGIGLALARQLVVMHGGTLEAFSDGPGRGSRFLVRLPRAPVAAADAAVRVDGPYSPPPPGGGQPRVLIVDDNQDAADSLVQVLRLAGYASQVAYDGSTALEIAAIARPAIVLLDLGLPDISGHEVARRIRAEPWGRATRLVAITGWGQEEDRRKSREAGFDEHLTKPVDPDRILRLLGDTSAGVRAPHSGR
jgi:PAS domain S-box-containing protein